GAGPGLVRRATERNEGAVDRQLVGRVEAGQRIEDLAVYGADRLLHPPTAKALAAIALLDRLMSPGRGPRRHRRAAHRAAVERHVDLDRGIAAAVEDLAGVNVGNGSHWARSFSGSCRVQAALGQAVEGDQGLEQFR